MLRTQTVGSRTIGVSNAPIPTSKSAIPPWELNSWTPSYPMRDISSTVALICTRQSLQKLAKISISWIVGKRCLCKKKGPPGPRALLYRKLPVQLGAKKKTSSDLDSASKMKGIQPQTLKIDHAEKFAARKRTKFLAAPQLELGHMSKMSNECR